MFVSERVQNVNLRCSHNYFRWKILHNTRGAYLNASGAAICRTFFFLTQKDTFDVGKSALL